MSKFISKPKKDSTDSTCSIQKKVSKFVKEFGKELESRGVCEETIDNISQDFIAEISIARYMPSTRVFPLPKSSVGKNDALHYVNVILLTDFENGMHRDIDERIVRDVIDNSGERERTTKVIHIRNYKVLGEISVAFETIEQFVRALILEIPLCVHMYVDLTNFNDEVISSLVYVMRYAKINLGCTGLNIYRNDELISDDFTESMLILEGGSV